MDKRLVPKLQHVILKTVSMSQQSMWFYVVIGNNKKQE